MTVSDHQMFVKGERATELGERVLEAVESPPAAARAQVEQLVEGDLRGRPSHGMQRLPVLVERIQSGVLSPEAVPRIESTAPGSLAVDGGHCFGPVAIQAVLPQLADLAHANGVGIATVRNAGHLGMLSPYLEELAELQTIGIVLTTSEALVHPTGGREPMVGTNPIGIGIPLEPCPFVLDMSTAAISAGEVIATRERALRLPVGAALDAEGRRTTDPEAALAGAISPFGGPKGYGLALGFELLVAGLTDTEVGRAVVGTLDGDKPSTKGDLVIAIDARSLIGGVVRKRLNAYLEELRTATPTPGSDGVTIPGDRMRAERQLRIREGIPYAAATWARLLELERAVA